MSVVDVVDVDTVVVNRVSAANARSDVMIALLNVVDGSVVVVTDSEDDISCVESKNVKATQKLKNDDNDKYIVHTTNFHMSRRYRKMHDEHRCI